jgi:hypothetical protein
MVLCSLVIGVNIWEEPAIEDLLIYPENGGIVFLQNSVTCLPNYVGHILEDCSLKGMWLFLYWTDIIGFPSYLLT